MSLLHQLSQCLQHFLTVVLKAPIDFIDLLILHNPQSAVSLLDQAGIMTHQNDTWGEEEEEMGRREGEAGRGQKVREAGNCPTSFIFIDCIC